MAKRKVAAILLAMLASVGSGCGPQQEMEAAMAIESAILAVQAHPGGAVKADLLNTEGKKLGAALLTETPQGVLIRVEATGLRPGLHGFHIHELGACTPPDFKSAGEHFNPTAKQHGFDDPKGYHAGDLPNLRVNADGSVKAEVLAKQVTLQKGKPNSLLKPGGTALVIHDMPDDYYSEPAGRAGDRIACGVVK